MLVVQKSIPAFRKYTVEYVGIKGCKCLQFAQKIQKKINVNDYTHRKDEACELVIEVSG